jgi:ubiquinone/menaquinone biosynthesis C-methylase UbiE
MLRVAVCILIAAAPAFAQGTARNIWAEQYKARTPDEMAKQFETPSRPVFRYRAAIAGLMQLKPGMTAAEIGAGSGFLARMMAQAVGASGKVIATELDPKMVGYMNDRARADGLTNFTAVQGSPTAAGLDPASVDALALVNTYSFFDRPKEMMQSIAQAVRPGGLLLIVDVPATGAGAEASGAEAEDVIAAAAAAGFTLQDESAVVPGQYAIRFRRK